MMSVCWNGSTVVEVQGKASFYVSGNRGVQAGGGTDFQDILSEEISRSESEELTDAALKMLRERGLSDEEIDGFKGILDRAQNAEDAKDFLTGLSVEERELVKRANSYGIMLSNNEIEGMSEEGARNMLVQPDQRHKVDFNNDGIVECGQAMTFQFPPPNAPEEVKDAWDKTLESLPESERLLASGIFMSMSLNSNIRPDGNGSYEIIPVGDPDYRNIFPMEKNGWDDLLANVMDYLDFNLDYAENAEQKQHIEKQMELVTAFEQNLFG